MVVVGGWEKETALLIVVARTNKVSQSVRANDGATWTGLLGALYKTATERNTGQGFIVNEILEMSSDYMLGIKQHNLSPYLQFIQSLLLLLLDVSLYGWRMRMRRRRLSLWNYRFVILHLLAFRFVVVIPLDLIHKLILLAHKRVRMPEQQQHQSRSEAAPYNNPFCHHHHHIVMIWFYPLYHS